MLLKITCIVILANAALTRHVPDIKDLDEEDQILFRAAYDTPSYNNYEYQEDNPSLSKLDLIKDGMWAIKTKILEMKAINKALAANMLATKLKLKELMINHLKKPIHIEIDKKPSYNYQAPPPKPSYPQYQYQQPQQQQYQPSPPQQPHYQPSPPQYAPPNYVHDPYYGH